MIHFLHDVERQVPGAAGRGNCDLLTFAGQHLKSEATDGLIVARPHDVNFDKIVHSDFSTGLCFTSFVIAL
jgi:hypothetical protein